MKYGSRESPSDALLFSLSRISLANPLFYRVSYLRIGNFILCGIFFEKLDNFGTLCPVTAVYALTRALTYNNKRVVK